MTDTELRELDGEIQSRVMGLPVLYVAGHLGDVGASLWLGTPTTLEECQKVCASWHNRRDDPFYPLTPYPKGNPRYSTDIAAAFTVVEKMREQGWSFACTLYEGKLPYASFCKGTVKSSRNAEAESLPEAICRAALTAIRDE